MSIIHVICNIHVERKRERQRDRERERDRDYFEEAGKPSIRSYVAISQKVYGLEDEPRNS